MSDYSIITRKVKVNFDFSDKEKQKEAISKLYNWQRICFRAANMISTHNFVIERLPDLIYLEEGTKKVLKDISKDPEGILNTSKLNATYKILSDNFKGEIPTSILTSLKSRVLPSNEERKQVYFGNRAIRTYKSSIPIPFQKSAIKYFDYDEERKNFLLEIFDIPLVTFLGQDKSRNRVVLNRVLEGEYELCDSAIQLTDKETFLFFVVKIPKLKVKLDESKVLKAHLSFDTPIVVYGGRGFKTDHFRIGNTKEYLHKRLQIQKSLTRLQKASKYNKGGHGRKRKLSDLDRFKKRELNFLNTRMHVYSRMLIDHALKEKASKIILANVQDVKEKTDPETPWGKYMLRNWSYYGLIDKIKYKAGMYGITIEEEPAPEEKKSKKSRAKSKKKS
jgi:IS605 OrfB family transposase